MKEPVYNAPRTASQTFECNFHARAVSRACTLGSGHTQKCLLLLLTFCESCVCDLRPSMTIFGFNSAVTYGDTHYHVQSEARPHDLVLQTMIFVKGQCVGKHTYSYAAKTLEAGFSEEAMHELLKSLHKHVIDA